MGSKKVLWEWTKRIFLIILGTGVMGLGYNLFLVPGRIAAGGVTGIATILYHLWRLPVGLMVAVINLPLLMWGAWKVDTVFILKTLVAIAFSSLWLEIIPTYILTQDMLMNAGAGGALVGIGIGFVFLADGTTGGSDLVARILTEKNNTLPIQWLMFAIDGLVIVASAMVFSIEEALYAVVAVLVTSAAAGVVMDGFMATKAFYIISDKNDEIARRVLNELERGVTALDAKGMYTGEAKRVLLCAISRGEEVRLREIVRQEDPAAFMLIANMHAVFGDGFQPHVRRKEHLFSKNNAEKK